MHLLHILLVWAFKSEINQTEFQSSVARFEDKYFYCREVC